MLLNGIANLACMLYLLCISLSKLTNCFLSRLASVFIASMSIRVRCQFDSLIKLALRVLPYLHQASLYGLRLPHHLLTRAHFKLWRHSVAPGVVDACIFDKFGHAVSLG